MDPATAGRWCGRTWAKINALSALMHVNVEGGHHIEMGRSYVVVANHQSQLDILVIYGWLGMDFRWVMKKELRKVPVLGITCEKLGHIFVDRSDRTAAIEAINQAKEKLSGGTSIFFFPEGTRSRDGNLLPFKKGAFRMAVDLKMPILPVSIVGTHGILPAGAMTFRPGRARLVIHSPIETAGCTPGEIPGLIQRTRAVIGSVI
jgi:1-acyl-sn-glycerol-3-phosphate acyltransferase